MNLPPCACGGRAHFHCDDYIRGVIVSDPDHYVECSGAGCYAQTPKSKDPDTAAAAWRAMVAAFDRKEPK